MPNPLCDGCEFVKYFDNEKEDCRKRASRYSVDPLKCCEIYKLRNVKA